MIAKRTNEDPRRRLLIKALALGAVSNTLLAGCVSTIAGLLGMKPYKLPDGQSVFYVEGGARVNGIPANKDTQVRPGDTVETDEKGQFVFVVGGHAMLMRGATKIEIGPNENPVISSLKLIAGKILAVSRNTAMDIDTPVASMRIKGTGWYAEADEDKTYFCTCYGETDIAAVKDPTSKTNVKAIYHDRPVYIYGGAAPGEGIVDGPLINHTDEELTLIEALVGREPPFVFARDEYASPRREY